MAKQERLKRLKKSGFTLMELLIVIAVVALLAAVTFVAIDPARRIGEARNSRRYSEVSNVKKALENYSLDNAALPSAISALSDNTNYMIAAAGDSAGGTVSCSALGTDITKVDIDNGTDLVPNYLATIPVDPSITTPYTSGTGYYFRKSGNIIVDVQPCNVYAYSGGGGGGESSPVITAIAFPNYGSEYTADTLNTPYIDTDTIDSTHAIIMYEKYTKVLTMTGASIAGNSRSTAAAANDEVQIEYIDTNKVVAGFNSTIGPNTVTDIGNTSPNPTTWAGDQNMNSVLPRYIKMKTLDSTHIVYAYADNSASNIGKVRVGTVGASTITWGTEATFNSGGTYAIGLAVLDSTHFVVTYRDTGDTNNGNAIVGSVSGTTISWETSETTFDSGAISTSMDAAALDSNKFIVMYKDTNNSSHATAIVGSYDGASTLTFGTKVDVSSATVTFNTVDAIDSNNAILVWTNSSNVANADVATISGNEITMLGSPTAFDSGNIQYPSVTVLDTENFVIGYQDVTGSNYAKAIVGTITWE